MNFVQNETLLRVLPFFSGFVVFLIIGFSIPFRKENRSLSSFVTNIILTFINSFVIGVFFPFTLGAWAIRVKENGWGILNILEIENIERDLGF